MKEELERLFSGIITADSLNGLDTNTYHWFRLENGEIIGLPANQLNERELALLHHFGSPVTIPTGSSTDTAWYQLLHSGKTADELTENALYSSGCRFIFFTVEGLVKPEVFREAMDSLTDHPLACLWFTKQTGLLIESRQTEPILYEKVIDMLMYDLSVPLRLFVTPWLHSVKHASEQYEWLLTVYKQIPFHSANHVLHFHDALPQLISMLMPENDRKYIMHHILQGLQDDDELLRTVNMYFTCNQNLTLTAKKLYIHRNSLNYRLDKLTEKTGLDIRKFQDAFALYLALHNLP